MWACPDWRPAEAGFAVSLQRIYSPERLRCDSPDLAGHRTQLPNYRILLKKEPEGGYTVLVPSLSGCVTFSDNLGEAIKMAKEAIELCIESLKAHGEEIPIEEGTLE